MLLRNFKSNFIMTMCTDNNIVEFLCTVYCALGGRYAPSHSRSHSNFNKCCVSYSGQCNLFQSTFAVSVDKLLQVSSHSAMMTCSAALRVCDQ